MKRALLIPLIMLLLASMACSLFTSKRANPPAEPTKEVVAPEKATQPAAAEPTETADFPAPVDPTEAAPTEAEPTEAEPTEAEPTEVPPTDEPELTEIEDTFDKDTGYWSEPHVVTSQAPGRDPIMKFTVGSGVLRWGIHDKETYAYKYFTEELPGATQMEVAFTNKGALNTGIALVCMANAEHTSWYEVRVSGADNFYHFIEYSKKRRDEEGKNPYIELSKGAMKYDQYSPMKPNRIVLTCTDSELSIDVNNGKRNVSYALDHQLEGSLFGIGVMSADVLPVNMEFESVTIR